MITSIFGVIQILLSLFGLWDQFMNWSDAKRLADHEAKTQNLNQAVDAQKAAQTEQDFEKDQTDIVNNLP